MDGVGSIQTNSVDEFNELTSPQPSKDDTPIDPAESPPPNTFAAGIARALSAGSRVSRYALRGVKSAARSGARYAARAQTRRSVAAGLESLATLTDVAGAMGSKAPAARTLVSRRVDTHVRFSAATSILGAFLRNAAVGALLFTVYESLHSRIPAHCSHPVLASAGAGAIAGALSGTVAAALEAGSRAAAARGRWWAVRSAAANIIVNAPMAAVVGAAEWSAGFSAWEYARKVYVNDSALVAATAGGGDTAPGTALFGVAAASMFAGAAQASGQAVAQAALQGAQSTTFSTTISSIKPLKKFSHNFYKSLDFKSLFRAMPAAAIGYAALEMSRYN